MKNNCAQKIRLFLFVSIATFIGIVAQGQPCNIPESPGLDCDDAPLLCNLDGYCSTTVNSNPQGAPPSFCGQIENAHWVQFVAGSTDLSIQVSPTNCGNGLQGHIYSTTNCSNFTPVSNCYDVNGVADFVLNATNLVIGEIYTILIDGKGGDVCDYTFTVLSGGTQVPEFAEAGADEFICPSELVQLDGSNSFVGQNFVYEWTSTDGNIVSGGNTLTPQVDAAGMYFLTVTDTLANCSHTDSVFVEAALPPEIIFETPDIINCVSNTTVTLSAENSLVEALNASFWYQDFGVELGFGLTLEVSEPGMYFLQIINLEAGCIDIDSVEVFADLETPVANAGQESELNCLAEEIQLNGTQSSSGGDFVTTWTTDTGNFVNGTNNLTPLVDAPGTYFLSVLNTENECEATDSVVITLNDAVPQSADIQVIQPCFGELSGEVLILGVEGGNPPFSYSLDTTFFSSNPNFSVVEIGEYLLTVKDDIGCEWETNIEVFPLDEFVLDVGGQREIIIGDSFLINTQTDRLETELVEIDWSPSVGLSCDTCLTPWAKPLETIVYHLDLVDENGCTATDQLIVFVDETPRVFLPNIFSPNGDGVNDLLFVQGGQELAKIVDFQVFNRWGGLVYQQENALPNDAGNGWNGTFQSENAQSAVYVYSLLVELIDGRLEAYHGDVLLVR